MDTGQSAELIKYLEMTVICTRAAVVHLNFQAGSTFPVPVYTYLALWTGLAGATRLTRSDFMLYIG